MKNRFCKIISITMILITILLPSINAKADEQNSLNSVGSISSDVSGDKVSGNDPIQNKSSEYSNAGEGTFGVDVYVSQDKEPTTKTPTEPEEPTTPVTPSEEKPTTPDTPDTPQKPDKPVKTGLGYEMDVYSILTFSSLVMLIILISKKKYVKYNNII